MNKDTDRCECRKIRRNHYNVRLPGGGRWTASIGGDCNKFRLRKGKKCKS